MITIVVNIKVKENKKSDFLKTIRALIHDSREEEGCISYELYENKNDEFSFVLIEYWISQDSVDLHNKTEHFITIGPKLRELASLEVNLYTKSI